MLFICLISCMSSMENCTPLKAYTTSIIRLCGFAVISTIGFKGQYTYLAKLHPEDAFRTSLYGPISYVKELLEASSQRDVLGTYSECQFNHNPKMGFYYGPGSYDQSRSMRGRPQDVVCLPGSDITPITEWNLYNAWSYGISHSYLLIVSPLTF